MPLFSYNAFDRMGKKIKGTIDAPTLDAAKAIIAQQNLYVISIVEETEYKGFLKTILGFFTRSGLSVKDKILFTKQLAVLLRAGIPLLQALVLLSEQFTGSLKKIITALQEDIKEGKSLAQAMGQFGTTFDVIYIQLVRAGEVTGKLEIVLERLVEYMEKREEIRAKIVGALRYPLIQLGMAGLIVVGLVTFVLPTLAANMLSSKTTLPLSTRLLMGSAYVLTNYWYIIISVLIAIIGAFRYWKSTERGSYIWDNIKLKMPIVGFFARTGAIVQFSRTLSILIESGVNITEALDIVVKIIDNRVLAAGLQDAREKIIKQGRIAEFLEKTGIFPKIVTYLISTGEQSGQLDKMLLTVAENYEKEVNEYADTLASVLDPIMMVIVGGIVGVVVMSVIQPIMQQAQGLGI